VGIGINMTEPQGGFSDDLKNTAGFLFEREGYCPEMKNMLTAEILNNLNDYCKDICDKRHIQEYKEKMFLLGRNVSVISSGHDDIDNEIVEVLDMNDEAGLIVRTKRGTIRTLISGEVSIR